MRQILFFGLIFVAWTNAQCLLNGFTAPLGKKKSSRIKSFSIKKTAKNRQEKTMLEKYEQSKNVKFWRIIHLGTFFN